MEKEQFKGYVEGEPYYIETTLFVVEAVVTEVGEQEILIKPFQFARSKHFSYHEGEKVPFSQECLLSRAQVVRAMPWEA